MSKTDFLLDTSIVAPLYMSEVFAWLEPLSLNAVDLRQLVRPFFILVRSGLSRSRYHCPVGSCPRDSKYWLRFEPLSFNAVDLRRLLFSTSCPITLPSQLSRQPQPDEPSHTAIWDAFYELKGSDNLPSTNGQLHGKPIKGYRSSTSKWGIAQLLGSRTRPVVHQNLEDMVTHDGETPLNETTVQDLLRDLDLLSESIHISDSTVTTKYTVDFLESVTNMFTIRSGARAEAIRSGTSSAVPSSSDSDFGTMNDADHRDDWSDSEVSGRCSTAAGHPKDGSQGSEPAVEMVDVDDLDPPPQLDLLEISPEFLARAMFNMIFKAISPFAYFTTKYGLGYYVAQWSPDRPTLSFNMSGLTFRTCSDGGITFMTKHPPGQDNPPSTINDTCPVGGIEVNRNYPTMGFLARLAQEVGELIGLAFAQLKAGRFHGGRPNQAHEELRFSGLFLPSHQNPFHTCLSGQIGGDRWPATPEDMLTVYQSKEYDLSQKTDLIFVVKQLIQLFYWFSKGPNTVSFIWKRARRFHGRTADFFVKWPEASA
ncbi:hypothetical protein C8J56DRAFT_1099976 [Mycena floridula]|nr:hypothetical protein C8J56DRAFT_1099976 [Mycena floridula]